LLQCHADLLLSLSGRTLPADFLCRLPSYILCCSTLSKRSSLIAENCQLLCLQWLIVHYLITILLNYISIAPTTLLAICPLSHLNCTVYICNTPSSLGFTVLLTQCTTAMATHFLSSMALNSFVLAYLFVFSPSVSFFFFF
jgi:hypothetical protein